MDVQSIMSNWTKNAGYPLVSVKARLNKLGVTVLTLTQERYYLNPQNSSSENDESDLWHIPIRIVSTHGDELKCVLFSTKSLDVDLGRKLKDNEKVLINHDKVGFYRVCYSPEMLNDLIEDEEEINKLNSLGKMGLISDGFSLAWSNHLSAFDLMRFVWTLRNENEPTVWKFLLDLLQKLLKCFLESSVHEDLLEFSGRLLRVISEKIGFEENEDDGNYLVYFNILNFKD